MAALLLHCNIVQFSHFHHYLTFLISYLQFSGGYIYNSDAMLNGKFAATSVKEMMSPDCDCL